VRFKSHVAHHWVTSKRDESFKDYVRRIYFARKSIDIETLEDVEGMRGDVRPFELPEKFLGHMICKVCCPTCNRSFQTAIPFKDFLTSGSAKTGTFRHYEDDAGCGSSFAIVETRHLRIRVQVKTNEGRSYETWIDLVS